MNKGNNKITELEQSYKGKVKTHNYINRQNQKGYQTKVLMPSARLYCFKCAIYSCTCLCVFIYPCIYLSYITVSAYDLCMYDM